jgi:membrane protease subunit HflK
VRDLMQSILDRYKVGIVVGINMQQGGVRPPEQVQAASTTCSRPAGARARQERGQAYANDVIPRAVGTAARLKEEARATRRAWWRRRG